VSDLARLATDVAGSARAVLRDGREARPTAPAASSAPARTAASDRRRGDERL